MYSYNKFNALHSYLFERSLDIYSRVARLEAQFLDGLAQVERLSPLRFDALTKAD